MYYKITNDQIWDTEKAGFVSAQSLPEGEVTIPLTIGEAYFSVDDLSVYLREKGLPLGELMTSEEKVQKELAQVAPILNERLYRQAAQTEAFTSTEFAILARAALYDKWVPGDTYRAGFRLIHEGIVYSVIQEVTSQAHQPPGSEGMLAIYRPLSIEGGGDPTGAIDDPIPFILGMDVAEKLHYSWKDHIYRAESTMPACVWEPDTQGMWQWVLIQ